MRAGRPRMAPSAIAVEPAAERADAASATAARGIVIRPRRGIGIGHSHALALSLREDRPCSRDSSSIARSSPSVLSIVITLAGGIALFALPIAQYPPISPPTVQVDCTYPGASAQVVAETVATPIEQQVNGVENMLYMSSQCTNDGAYNLTVTFKHGVDLNMAQVLVQNRVALALPLLPDVHQADRRDTSRRGRPTSCWSIALNSPDGRYDQLYLSNYALIQIKDELARLPGVSDVTMLGQRDYSMRIWVDPEKLAVAQHDGRRRGQRRSASRTSRWPPGRSASRRSPAASASRSR